MDANCLVFCIFQPDHVPDPWMNAVCFASSNPTMLPTVDENCPFCFIQPDHLGRPQQRLQQPLARWGFGKWDSGTGIQESRRSERLMLLVGLFLFSSGIVGKLLDYVKSFIVPKQKQKEEEG
jgi:hypothetical protein